MPAPVEAVLVAAPVAVVLATAARAAAAVVLVMAADGAMVALAKAAGAVKDQAAEAVEWAPATNLADQAAAVRAVKVREADRAQAAAADRVRAAATARDLGREPAATARFITRRNQRRSCEIFRRSVKAPAAGMPFLWKAR